MSREERGFPIFKKRKVIKNPKLIGKPTQKIRKTYNYYKNHR